MKWEPWNKLTGEVPILDIEGPPCSNCKHWKPQPKIDATPTGFVYVGVKLCHVEKMYADFSCFELRN